MALTACEECGGTVSRNADSCPHCGSKKFWVGPKPTPYPTKPRKKWKDMDLVEKLFVILVFGGGIALVGFQLFG